MRKQSRSRFRWYWCWNRFLEFLRLGDCGMSSHWRELQDGAILTRSFPESLNLYPVSVWGLCVPPPIIRTFQTVNRATIRPSFFEGCCPELCDGHYMAAIGCHCLAVVSPHSSEGESGISYSLWPQVEFRHYIVTVIWTAEQFFLCCVTWHHMLLFDVPQGSYSRSLVPTMVVAVESRGR